MSKEAMKNIIDAMGQEQYATTVGDKTDNPLHTFSAKRPFRMGIGGGIPIMPPPRANGVWREKMAQQPTMPEKRTAYIHIPFCSKICLYCGFFQNHANEDKETAYIDSLIKEMQMDVDKPYLTSSLIHAVFMGGGTPSALSPENSKRLLSAIKEYLPLANDCEITMEARINDLNEPKMETWFANGVNRVSIGVQSFDTAIRQGVGRIDNRDTVIKRLAKISSYGQASIIIDLIYGLPGQSKESFVHDLGIIDSLPIDGMDLYQLSIFENGPMVKAIEAGNLPPAASYWEQAEMFAEAVKWLDDRAYFRLSNCHWAKNNRERSMYNMLTKSGAEMFPYGSGAGGNINGMSMMLHRDMGKYLDAVAKSEKPIMFSTIESPGKAMQTEITRQMELSYIDVDSLAARYGEQLKGLEYLLDLWVERGLLTKGPVLYKVETAGQYWIKNIVPAAVDCAEALLDKNM